MKISCTEVISAPKAKVFGVFSDIANAKDRLTGITALEVLSDIKAGEGLRWRETRTMFGKEATEEMEITAFNEPDSYVVEAESHGTHYTSRFSFAERSPETTAVTWEFEGRPVTLAARMLSPLGILFKGATKKALERDVLDLKRHIES